MRFKFPIKINEKNLIDFLVPIVIFILAIGQRTLDTNSILHILQPIFIGVICLTFVLLFLKTSPKVSSIKNSWILTLFVALLLVSTLWSKEPVYTFVSSLWLIISTLLSYFLVIKYSFNQFVYLIFYGLLVVLLLSTVAAILSPSFAVHIKALHFGAWKGIYFHKSGLGRETALVAVLGLFLLRKPFNIMFYAFCFLIVFKTQSTISLLVLVAVFAFFMATNLMSSVVQFKSKKVLIMFIILGLSLTVLIVNYQLFVTLLGKDQTFGARLLIWSYSITNLEHNLMTGFGYHTFWLDDQLSEVLTWDVPHAHNHFIEVLLDVGLVGFFLFLVILIRFFIQVNRLDHKSKLFNIVFASMFLIIGISLSEEPIYDYFNLSWIYFAAIVLYMENPKRLYNAQ